MDDDCDYIFTLDYLLGSFDKKRMRCKSLSCPPFRFKDYCLPYRPYVLPH
nr:MAG TPA: hypothetical protein [Myoviridae sp. ctRUJ25]